MEKDKFAGLSEDRKIILKDILEKSVMTIERR
jgi:hypothetical protein